jgi:Asp/Glu/hydantoin racemase
MAYTVAALYTAHSIVDSVSKHFYDRWPGVRLINLVDGSLIPDVIAANEVTQAVERRLLRYYMACEDMAADVILNTCSSIGEATIRASRYITVPIVNIDRAMAESAVQAASSIAVLATLSTTLGPTMRLIEGVALEQKKDITVVDGLAAGAFEALSSGNADKHDRLLAETSEKVAEKAEAIVLAQGSMARMAKELAEKTGKPVYTSIASGIDSLKRYIDAG